MHLEQDRDPAALDAVDDVALPHRVAPIEQAGVEERDRFVELLHGTRCGQGEVSNVIAHVGLDGFPRRNICAQPFQLVIEGLGRLAVPVGIEQARPERRFLSFRLFEDRVGGHVVGPVGPLQQQEGQIDRIDAGHVAISLGVAWARAAASSSSCEARKPPTNSQVFRTATASAITHRLNWSQ
ncbi:Uncharacterised protein [Mycobacterium tuberculosis]|nr:Uncharacterised protein [Mycobacterium tuberculosis]